MTLFNVRFFDYFLQRTLWKKWRECTKGLISDFYTSSIQFIPRKGKFFVIKDILTGKVFCSFTILCAKYGIMNSYYSFPSPFHLPLWSASPILYIPPPPLSLCLSMSVILSLGLSIFLLLSHNTPYLFSVSPPLPNPPRSAYIKCKAN